MPASDCQRLSDRIDVPHEIIIQGTNSLRMIDSCATNIGYLAREGISVIVSRWGENRQDATRRRLFPG